jgi:hypothetical protein
MTSQTLLRCLAALALASLVSACAQKNTADSGNPGNEVPSIDRFLLFPNPVGTDPAATDGGTFETATNEYAAAYYFAIDKDNLKDTLDKWRKENGFTGYANPPRLGTENLAVFRDAKDLGYGRRMTGRRNSDDDSVAFYVENYKVTPGSAVDYASELNVEAAVRRDTQWHVGTNAIEWSTTPCINLANVNSLSLYDFDPPDCSGSVKFAKYYSFSPADGTRQLSVDLDGKGKKAMPGPCITCHGGRGDPLTPTDVRSGQRAFALVENSLSRKRGDVQGRLHGMNVDNFGYSVQPGFTKADQQAKLKTFNQWILCTYPSPTAGAIVSNDGINGICTRPTAGPNEWQGTAGPMIEAWYLGTGLNGMPSLTFADTYVPQNWQAVNVGQPAEDLYRNVVAPYCRTCHIVRGTKNQSDIDFMTLAKFQGYADRTKAHVFDRGNMPLALIVYDDFWNSSAPQMLATYIDSVLGPNTATAGGVVLKPGRPIAGPGPNRMVSTLSPAKLSAAESLFATTYTWSVIGTPIGTPTPTILSPNSRDATFPASPAGDYTVRLIVGDGTTPGSTKDVVITADATFPDPASLFFPNVQAVLGSSSCASAGCHSSANTGSIPPIFYNSFDRNRDAATDTIDDDWLKKELSGRVNFTEIQASPLLRKPTGNHHAGGAPINLATTGLRNYSIFYNWILEGAR